MLRVENLVKEYNRGKRPPLRAVNGITFEVRSGECYGLLGPNGAGKSTTNNCITGFYPLTEGRILIDGINVHEHPKQARQIMGVCPQDDTLDSDFTVLDQLVRHATFFKMSVEEGRTRALELLKQFRLEDKAKDEVQSLSGGMRRRLQVARSLLSQPRVLLLDEPTTELDPEVRRVLWGVIETIRAQGTAVLLCTHYMEEAERLCDRIAILSQGKILDEGAPRELIRKHIGTEMVDEEIRPGLKWNRPANLEDVYLKLTGQGLGT
jgi:lipooligosaccharide transport system ATP-binding protein